MRKKKSILKSSWSIINSLRVYYSEDGITKMKGLWYSQVIKALISKDTIRKQREYVTAIVDSYIVCQLEGTLVYNNSNEFKN